MSAETAMLLALAVPALGAVAIALTGNRPNLREGATLTCAATLLLIVAGLVPTVAAGDRPEVTLLEMFPGLAVRFQLEPLGMVFAGVAALLWPLNSIYSIGYMRGNGEGHQTRFYVCFAIALCSAMGVAFAGNLLTLFIFYEALTLSTYPLVTHKGSQDAMRAGRVYLGLLLGTSIGFLLLAIIWTWAVTGTIDFRPGGILDGKIDGIFVPLLLGLYMFGIGKAALMPFHRWLPAAMVAPTPVSALLHAVAVVKAGVFTVMKVTVYVFGIDFLSETGASRWLVWVAAATLLIASLVALSKDNLKARLAYSTVSQLAYVVLGAALATSMGVIGGSLQIAMHAVGKITLFFCAGAIYTATHKTEVSELDGLGRLMPFTFGAFLLGALSIIGLPPFGGSWSKWYLMLGAAEAGQLIMIGVLMVSSLLNIAYLLPVVARGFFLPAPTPPEPAMAQGAEVDRIDWGGLREAPLYCVAPLCLTAVGCVVLFFYADDIYRLLAPIAAPMGEGG
jgi:multicomponent Na+:H+ antiporter subunit D